MSNIFPSKGCFYRFRKGSSTKYYKLEPSLSSDGNIPILLQSASRNLVDIVAPVACLDNIKKFYTFGQGFGQISISGIILLGPSGSMNSGEKIVESYFQSNRSSDKSAKLLKLSGGTSATPFFLTYLRFGDMNPETHVLSFTLSGVVLEPKK